MLEVNTPSNTLYPDAVYGDTSNVKSAVLGLYGGVAGANTYLTWLTLFDGLYADEIFSTSYPYFGANALSSADTYVPYVWSDNYTNIYRANAIIEGVQSSTALTTTIKNQALGEALFWRAYCHFILWNTFGHIPLITTTDVTTNAVAPQVADSIIFRQMISDLQQSAGYLPADYSLSGNERTRVNRWAAIALLSKVYLYQGDWANAAASADSIIGSSLFNLSADITKVFLNTSTEAILQFDNKSTGYAPLAWVFIPVGGAVPEFILQEGLVHAFEPEDQRKVAWTGTSAGYYYPAKYKVTSTGSSEYPTLLRLADIVLVRAEARAQLNNITEAQNDLNTIRQRAGLGNTAAADQSTLLLAIEQERRVELFCEYGNRWYDLKRTGRADAVLSVEKSGWNATDINFPIPILEISRNSRLKQNEGY